MSKREDLQKAIDQAKARLAAIDAREKAADRRARTRRAIVLGNALLTALAKGGGPQIIEDAKAWLSTQQLRPQDRKAWDLPG